MQLAFLFKIIIIKKCRTPQNLKNITVIQVCGKLNILQKGVESALHKLAKDGDNNNTEIFSDGKFFSFIFS